MKTIILSIFLTLCLLLSINNTAVYSQSDTMVGQYGCAALYTSDNPTELAVYMSQLIGYTPMVTELSAYVDALPLDKCSNFDLGRMIFNVCGEFGDKHEICESWKASFPKYYGNEVIYTYYVATLKASQGGVSVNNDPIDVIAQSERSQPQQEGGGINIIQILVALIILAIGAFVMYNIRMRKSTPNKPKDNNEPTTR